MNTIRERIKNIERFMLEHAEELELDEEELEEDWQEYAAIPGASSEELQAFEEQFQIKLPKEFQELYQYKNGSGYIRLFWSETDLECGYRLLSLQEMTELKSYFQNKTCEMAEFPEIIEEARLQQLDERIKPYLFCERWFPFAKYEGSLYLMLDYDPSEEGEAGQIICYVHDPDFIYYIAGNLNELLEMTESMME